MDDPAAATVITPRLLAAGLLCVGGTALLLNAAILIALFGRDRSGTLTIIMNMVISDLLTVLTAGGAEIWSRNAGTWELGTEACVGFLGCEVFATASGAYLLATLTLHALASASRSAREERCDAETRSSRRSLVSDSSTPPRSMRIEYRARDPRVAVCAPLACAWLLAASLSVPEFALGTTVELRSGPVLCTFVDPRHRFDMHVLLTVFELLVPVILLVPACALVALRLRRRPDATGDPLRLSLCACAAYAALSAPRVALTAVHALRSGTPVGADQFRNPALHTSAVPPLLALLLSCSNLVACALRPVLYFAMLPDVRKFLMNVKSIGRARADNGII